MRRIALLLALASTTAGLAVAAPAVAQSRADDARFAAAQDRMDRELALFRAESDRYRAARNNGRGYQQQGYNNGQYNNGQYNDERVETGYEPSRYYRDDPRYQERVLASDDRVYRGNDGRYYCKRSDGTTGLIIGAAGGGILGNVIDGGRSRTVGTLIGAALGGLAGRAVERNQAEVRCR
ncbi:glycine zipper 2TM domain-containing protein [Sphingomonas sp. SUN039]|uniref:glycine zipper 2TM domain-containing protein n=1 Tax=Sphingomonas sp. SUN039 TaxID=2937787 RepID=UPI002164AFBE|nr:glycine zipper 2TM domain-containing protein [Sphingomonas sp. SUN039]UVO52955.1 glycine zipper 2TM domain-containing protein [Sphingomonas sp. SUN039]